MNKDFRKLNKTQFRELARNAAKVFRDEDTAGWPGLAMATRNGLAGLLGDVFHALHNRGSKFTKCSTYPGMQYQLTRILETYGLPKWVVSTLGKAACVISNYRHYCRDGYAFKGSRYVSVVPDKTSLAKIVKGTREFLADPRSRYAKIPYAIETSSHGVEYGVFCSPVYGLDDYNSYSIVLDTPRARQAFIAAEYVCDRHWKATA